LIFLDFAGEIRISRGPRVARAPTPLPIHAGKRCFSAERANASKKRPQRAYPSFVGEGTETSGQIINYIDVPWPCFFSDADFLELIPRIADSCRFCLYLSAAHYATWQIVAHLERS